MDTVEHRTPRSLDRSGRAYGIAILGALVVSLLVGDSSATCPAPASEALSQLADQIRNGHISSIEVIDDHIVATSASGQTWSAPLGNNAFLSAMEALDVTEEQLRSVSTINETASSNSDRPRPNARPHGELAPGCPSCG
jgi:hypothetical protein